MITRALLLTTLSALLVVSASPAQAGSPPTIGQHVVLAKGVPVYSGPDTTDGQKLLPIFTTFEVTAVKAGRVGLKPTRGCYAVTSLGPYQITVWADSKQLSPVLTHKLSKRYRDGSGYELLPGLVLSATGQKVALFETLEVRLAKATRPRSGFSPLHQMGNRGGSATSLTEPRLNGEPANLRWGYKTAKKRVFARSGSCHKVFVRAKGNPNTSVFGSSNLGVAHNVLVPYELAKGAPIFWPSGVQAGVAAKLLRYLARVRDGDQGVCWSVGGLTLCGRATRQVGERIGGKPEPKHGKGMPLNGGRTVVIGAGGIRRKISGAHRCKPKQVFTFGECRSKAQRDLFQKQYKARGIAGELKQTERRWVKEHARWKQAASPTPAQTAAVATLAADVADLYFERFLSQEMSGTAKGKFSAKVIKKQLMGMLKALKRAQTALTTVIDYKLPGETACAVFRMGALYDVFAQALDNVPAPPKLSKAQRAEYLTLLAGYAQPIREKAVTTYRAAVAAATKANVANACVDEARAAAARLKP